MNRMLKPLLTAKLALALTLVAGTGVLAAQVALPGAADPAAAAASANGIETANQAPTGPDGEAPTGQESAAERLAEVVTQLDDNAARLLATLDDAIARLQENGANQAAIDAVSAVRDSVQAGDHGLGTAAEAVANAPAGNAQAAAWAGNRPDAANHPSRP